LSELEPPPTNGDLQSRFEHVQHWWREPVAGFVSVGVAAYDCWHFGRNDGFSTSLDEILLLTGIALIAGVRNLFGSRAPNGDNKPP
jgi:hypothetical protein